MDTKLSLLVADDEALIRRKLCMMLADRFCIDEVETAQPVLESACRGYDAFLLDIVFPDGNGIALCREIKRSDPHSTVVIMSSMESVDAWNDAFTAGADGYLEKRELLGLDPRKIILMIENLVERNRLRRHAEDLNRRQAQILSMLSHDVKAPFQALLGTIDLLRTCDGIPTAAATKVETLHTCVKDQLAFINSLLELLRLESGMAGLRLVPIDINLPVNQCLQALRIVAAKKDISVRAELQQGLPKMRGDIGRICQLVNNLVSNAIKFTPRGGHVDVTTMSERYGDTDGVRLSVSDTGVGIGPPDRGRIFEPFHRGRNVGTEGERGTGLGLSICREIVELHGGRLELDGERPSGSMFVAWFPADGSSSDPLVAQTSRTDGAYTACPAVGPPD
jgi:signal transduction histidine kinase